MRSFREDLEAIFSSLMFGSLFTVTLTTSLLLWRLYGWKLALVPCGGYLALMGVVLMGLFLLRPR